MANEIYYSGLGDLRMAAILHQELLQILADRASLWDNPALTYFGDLSGRGSTVLQIGLAGLDGYDRMAAVAENASVANTALTDASVNITIARQALQYSMSSLAELTDSVGLNVMRLAQSMVGSAQMRLTELVADLVGDFTTVVGTTQIDMSADNWFAAEFALEQASVPGPYAAVLYPVQWTDLQQSIRAEIGPWQFVPAVQDALSIKGPGFAGTLNGIEIYKSSLVPTANAGEDSAGGMFGRGAIGWVDAAAPAQIVGAGGIVYPAGTRIFVEFERDASGALTKIVGNYFCGVAIIENARGVAIITDR